LSFFYLTIEESIQQIIIILTKAKLFSRKLFPSVYHAIN